MSQGARPIRMTFREYVAFEQASDTKHEFIDGEAWAMAGGTPEHAQLAAGMIRELGNALEGGPCKVFTADLRIGALESDLVTYPDVSVVCGPLARRPEDDCTITNPSVIIEVLSDSTEGYDRGDKFFRYRRVPSLRAYVLVSQHEPLIEVYRRNDDQTWTLEEFGPGDSAKIGDLCAVSVDAVYRGVELPARAPEGFEVRRRRSDA